LTPTIVANARFAGVCYKKTTGFSPERNVRADGSTVAGIARRRELRLTAPALRAFVSAN
jgi:hypothetical protein